MLKDSPSCDQGNRTLRWSQFCDGIFDCYDRSDEEGRFCKLCVNNLYSCPPKDDLRCDLACQMLHYVPCQSIQDRRACNHLFKNFDHQSLFDDLKFYILVISLVLFVMIGIFCLIKYLYQCFTDVPTKSSKASNDYPHPIETDTLSSHIYEQCDELTSYRLPSKYPYYEHVV